MVQMDRRGTILRTADRIGDGLIVMSDCAGPGRLPSMTPVRRIIIERLISPLLIMLVVCYQPGSFARYLLRPRSS